VDRGVSVFGEKDKGPDSQTGAFTTWTLLSCLFYFIAFSSLLLTGMAFCSAIFC